MRDNVCYDNTKIVNGCEWLVYSAIVCCWLSVISMKATWPASQLLHRVEALRVTEKYNKERSRVEYVLKQGDALSPLQFNFALERAIRK
jgi:hypothetical protein